LICEMEKFDFESFKSEALAKIDTLYETVPGCPSFFHYLLIVHNLV